MQPGSPSRMSRGSSAVMKILLALEASAAGGAMARRLEQAPSLPGEPAADTPTIKILEKRSEWVHLYR